MPCKICLKDVSLKSESFSLRRFRMVEEKDEGGGGRIRVPPCRTELSISADD